MSDDRFKTGGGVETLNGLTPGADAFIGRQLGDYKVIELIAEGGMGRVYRAERVDGSFERAVALKVSPIGGFDEKMRERFQLEQSLLAGLDHPNIAQLYDSQTTAEGWPCIVMELVDGGPIDEYCEEHSLSLEHRIRLFIKIVDAVALAHSRLVVHRDIKPSNVLITSDGRPKLLDFGIAKTLESDDKPVTKGAPLTPHFASPEQLLGEPITTASDIYQLGHLLHHVLAGSKAHDELPLADAIRRAALKTPVVLPEASRRSLPRDVIAVIEQCLCVNPDERYRDATTLQDDLNAFLDGFPVRAAGQGSAYRFRKFVSRHRVASVVSALALVFTIAGSALYTWQLTAARDDALGARNESEAVLEFMVDMLASANPNAEGEDYKVSELLDAAAATLTEDLSGSPYVRARIHNVIGDTLKSLGRESAAEAQHQVRLSIYDELGDQSHPGRLDALYDIAWLKREQGDYESAYALGQEAVDAAVAGYGPRSAVTAQALRELADSYFQHGSIDDARPLIERALEIYNGIENPDVEFTRDTLSTLAQLRTVEKNYEEARRLYQQVYDIDAARFGEDHMEPLISMGKMLFAEYRAGHEDEARAGRRKQLEIMRRVLGDEHPYTLITMVTLASVLEPGEDNFAEREKLLLEAIRGYRAHGDRDASRLLGARYSLGWLYRDVEMYDKSIKLHKENLRALRDTLGDESPLTIFTLGDLAASLCASGQPQEALPLIEEYRRKASIVFRDGTRTTEVYDQEHARCVEASP